MRVRSLVFAAVVFTVIGVNRSRLSADQAGDSLLFTLTGSGQILVPVMIGRSGPFQFILDTGANRSVVSDSLAAQLALEPIAVTETVTSTGSSMNAVVELQSISLGAHHASKVASVVMRSERIHAVHERAVGIIGQDVLIDARYTLDYRRKRVTWLTATDVKAKGTRLALRRSEGRLLVELPQASNSAATALFVPDSGASTLVLFHQEGRTAIPSAPLTGTVNVTTVTGEGQLRMAIVPKLKLGQDTLWEQPALVIPSPASTGTDRLDGLLPLSLFSEVTFNGPESYLIAKR